MTQIFFLAYGRSEGLDLFAKDFERFYPEKDNARVRINEVRLFCATVNERARDDVIADLFSFDAQTEDVRYDWEGSVRIEKDALNHDYWKKDGGTGFRWDKLGKLKNFFVKHLGKHFNLEPIEPPKSHSGWMLSQSKKGRNYLMYPMVLGEVKDRRDKEGREVV